MNSNDGNKIDYAKSYVNLLAESFRVGWFSFYDKICSADKISNLVIYKLVLLHPLHYQELASRLSGNVDVKKKMLSIQGKRTFSPCNLDKPCQSKDLWNYDCPLTEETKVFDHDFPYSLGGPTDNAFNKRILCKWHNMIKANDIHCYNWEKLFDEYNYYRKNQRTHWIDRQIDKIKKEFIV